MASCTVVFCQQRFGQRQKWCPRICGDRNCPLGTRWIGDEMPVGFRHPHLSNIWKTQAGISSLKNRLWAEVSWGKHMEKAVHLEIWERFRAKPRTCFSEKPGPGVFAGAKNWDKGQRLLMFVCFYIWCTLCISQGMSTVPGTCSGQRTFKWQLCPLLKVSVFVLYAALWGDLVVLCRRVWLGQQPSDGMGQKAPAEESKLLQPWSLPGGVVWHTSWQWGWRNGGRPCNMCWWFVLKDCLRLGIGTRWYWEK